MQEDLRNLIRVWIVAVPAALAYCYALPSFIMPGKRRLLAVLPVIVLFFLLPFSLSSIHLRFVTASFLCWLAVFKLLLFAFDRGPLCDSSSGTRLALPGFIAIASLPIMVRREPRKIGAKGQRSLSIIVFAVKGLLSALVVLIYPQRPRLHRGFVLALYSLQMYLEADMMLAIVAVVGRAMLPSGTDLEPQFAAPYLSSSLQEFWARRWNIMVSCILRDAVYRPVRAVCGRAAGVLAAFLVSGLMHEILWVYLTLQAPTGEVTTFFVLQGFCTVAEEAAKKWWIRRGLAAPPPALRAPLIVGFVTATSWWLFMPQVERSPASEQIVKEAEAFLTMLRTGRLQQV